MGQKDFLTTKIKDAAESAIYRQETVYLDFYEPSVQLLIEREIARYPSSDCAFFGGHPYCERKILCVFPKGEPPQDEEFPIACVQIATDEPITHQDVLGALLGLGIEREKTGDINLSAQMIQLFVAETLGEFVERNLTQINRYAVEAKVVWNERIVAFEPVFKEMDIIVPSTRADAVVHALYKLSRSEAAALIKAEKVKINDAAIVKPSVTLKPNDIVSVRTKGKFIFDDVLGNTKKGNLKIRIRKFS
jgi:RNA-binding protein YlmH